MTATPDLFEMVTLTELLQRQQMIRVTQIRVDGGTQMRAAINPETVADYAARFQEYAGWGDFPAVILFYDGTDYWLGDGYHRIAAWRQAFHGDSPHDTVRALVNPGTRRDAILYAAGANSNHGLRRTNADKRRAVETLLRDEEWRKWSDHEIARRCCVDPKTVGNIRRELTVEFPQSNTRKAADGRAINTANIGSNRDSSGGRRPEIRESAAANVVVKMEPPTAPATLDNLPLVDAKAFPAPIAEKRQYRRNTYAWLRTIYAEARDELRTYEDMTGDFTSRGPLLRVLEPMIATLDRHLAVYEPQPQTQEDA